MSQAESAQHFYDRISGVYDALSDKSEHEARSLGLRLLAPGGDDQVLEIGFGTGHCLVEIAELLGPGGRVHGIDVSRGMLETARRRVEESSVSDRIARLELADAKALPFEEGSFDAVFLSFTLELFDEKDARQVLAEIARVLRDGGRLGVVAMHDDGRHGAMVDLYRFMHRHFPHIVDCRPIDIAGVLEGTGWNIVENQGVSIWGLPVRAVVARRAG